jgi:nicotinate-nucleotide pyrophosphorylase (carboxylating)
MRWDSPDIREIIHTGLREDAARHDITTRTVIPARLGVEARIVSHQRGVVCGLPLARAIFKARDPHSHFVPKVADGDSVKPETTLAVIHSRARVLLSAERPALNALQHLSGIATYTRQQVRRLRPSKTLLYDTRKTLPGWRLLQKYAVRCGGGNNHRLSLANFAMMKDNHLKICRLARTDWVSALKRLHRKDRSIPIEMEVQTQRDLKDAFRLAPDWVMLDNMPILKLRSMMRQLRQHLPGIKIEISGGIRPDHLRSLKKLGAERLSMGRLTHSAPTFDCSLVIDRVVNAR